MKRRMLMMDAVASMAMVTATLVTWRMRTTLLILILMTQAA